MKKFDEWHKAQQQQSEKAIKLADEGRFEQAILSCDGMGYEMRLGTFDCIFAAIRIAQRKSWDHVL